MISNRKYIGNIKRAIHAIIIWTHLTINIVRMLK